MQNLFLKKEKASIGYKVLSFFFAFSLVLSTFAPSLVIAQEVVAENEQIVEQTERIIEPTNVVDNTASIRVCKIILDAEGNVITGDAGTTFTIPGMPIETVSSQNSEMQVAALTDSSFSTPLNLNSEIITDDDAQCVTYDNLASGHYFYGEEEISDPENWEEPKYNDQVSVNIEDFDDFFEYNGALFTETTADDEARNQNADGDILLGNGAHRTLVVLNQMKEQVVEENQCLETMTIVSDGTETVDETTNFAVPTFTHNVWYKIPYLGIGNADGFANWIWETFHVIDSSVNTTKTFSKYFEVPGVVQTATLEIAADNSYKVSINSNDDVYVDGEEDNYTETGTNAPGDGKDDWVVDASYFNEGGNTFKFEVKNFGGDASPENNPAGLTYKLDIGYLDNECMNPNNSTITVTKEVNGGQKEVSDFHLFVDETEVTSGETNEFEPGTYTIHEDGDENYIPSFSGACVADFNNANRINMIHDWVEKRNALMIANPNSPNIADINAKIDALLNSITATITLGEDEDLSCTITNTYTNHTTEYGAYCGDGEVNQEWETCDGGESCTDQCQSENVCSEKAFARVVVPAGPSHIKNFGNGDMTSDVYLGGNGLVNKIPNGSWFMIHDGANWMTDGEALIPNLGAYENVPGFAVQRGANFVRLSMYSSSPKTTPATKEHADGWLEFFNIDTTGLAQVSDGDDNIVEKSNDTLKDYTPGQDELSVSDGKSNFWLTVGPEDDSFKTTFGNRLEDDCVPEDNNNGGETCEENPNQEKCNQEEENNGGGGSGGSNRSGSRPTGNVLGDSTTDLPGQVLGATLAQTGTDVSPMIYLGMTMLGLLFITRRKAFKF